MPVTPSPFLLQRIGEVMMPMEGEETEVEGVLNPACARDRMGQLYLFPRLVAKGNYSRIGIAKVIFNTAGDPCGVERMGIVLEPTAPYELSAHGGGCEDPRITFVPSLDRYLMTYTALSNSGPRIALAISENLTYWRRLGLAKFAPYLGVDFVHVGNKDASFFPIPIQNHSGKLQLAMLHRPLFPGSLPEQTCLKSGNRIMDLDHESIWISYCPFPAKKSLQRLGLFNSHHRLAMPLAPWENLKIGGGAPPILTALGWLLIYHGVGDVATASSSRPHL